MDKETLSNYGWIVICVLVLAVMLALATPFGKFISNAIKNTTTALFQTSKAGLGSAGIDAGELVFGKQDGDAENPDTPDASDKLIPDGGIYKKADGTTLEGNGTNTFPETPADGDEYEEGDYTYKYNQYYDHDFWYSDPSQNGWGVRVKDTSKTEYGEILSEIAGQPITNMYGTFYGCRSLTTAPTIPNSVTSMDHTFDECSSLATAPTIPNSVTNMTYTFCGCYEITAAPAIPNSVTNMCGTFDCCFSLTTAPTIPNSVTDMSYTFLNCTSLTTAPAIPNSVTNMDSTFMDCNSLKTYVGSTDPDGNFSNYVIPSSVTNMSGTFSGCTSLTTVPVIPNSVTDMIATFQGCTSLTTAPTIPNSVTKMVNTFRGCTSLKGTIEINANPTSYDYCFAYTVKPITLVGTSAKLTELAASATNSNVTVG